MKKTPGSLVFDCASVCLAHGVLHRCDRHMGVCMESPVSFWAEFLILNKTRKER